MSIDPDTEGTVTIIAGKGGYEKVTASADSILSSGKGSKVSINENKGGQVKITGDMEAINNGSISINGTKAESSIQGNVLAENGTINLKLTGDNSTMQGNLTTKDYYGSKTNAAITAEFSGNSTKFTGDADNVASMGLTFNNGSNWTGNLKNTSGTSTVGLTNGSSWTGSLTNTSGDSTVSLSNGSLWTGDLTNTSGTTTVNLDGSIWDGAANGDGDLGTRDITLTNGSLWSLSADSFVNSLNLDRGSVISLAGNAHTLETMSLGGSGGTFLMDLNYQGDDVNTYREGDSSDYIVAHGGNGSTYGVALSGDSHVNGMTEGSKLYFATTGADSSAFKLDQNVEVQNFNKIYNNNLSVLKDTGNLSVKKETDTTDSDFKGADNWYLTPDASKGHDGDTINPNGTVPGSAINTAFALWRDDDTLSKRLGELRYSQQDDGIWARMVNKHLERDGRHSFEGNYKTIQVGYDKKKDTENNGSWYYGGAISHLWGDTNYTDGHGSQKETDLSLYGTNIRPHGHYLDLIARVGRIDSDYTTSYGDHGKFENWGMSFGAEYGCQKALGGGWSIEPQAQLTYHYLWGDDYTTRNGAKVNQDNADSLVGRLGFVLSRDFNAGTTHAGRVYLKASILHDFLGDTTSTIVDDIHYRDDDDLGDTWYIAGIGTDINLGKNTRFYFDAERNFNADVKMKYRFNAGLRFGF
ncbi:autotransporter outer membrane beta-barrel domain-containing protein [uncultured Dialister sp.]|uniref:autotransporter outer membrane beta-barrel domain-containing protein n=1 Tax=uncultured Dialister sp. TaxID=278064 RepID=UPI002594A72B|nr:autotransporter outer membrane beta-barrel domain-containing protein [uncultured Dialister sp.]